VALAQCPPQGWLARNWLERLRIEHQGSPQSFPFLIGAINAMLLKGEVWSPNLVESLIYPALHGISARGKAKGKDTPPAEIRPAVDLG
jgi:hypothetical protein